MEAKYQDYILSDSLSRIDAALESSDENFKDHKGIPPRNSLTFDNGFNVTISVIYIDLRDSTTLSNNTANNTLAKIYRSYISECIAILKSNTNIDEVYIEGDGVWGVINTNLIADINETFGTAAKLNSLIILLNQKLKAKNYPEIRAGIGISYSESLLIKTGYSGSGNNEIVWVGKTVGEAAKLCSYGNKTLFHDSTYISNSFYHNLDPRLQSLMSFDSSLNCYKGSIINLIMTPNA